MNPGFHHIVDFHGCDPAQLEELGFWKRVMGDAVRKARMEVLHDKFHRFKPYGLTGFLLLSTSHLSVHTWPEHRHAACDLFSCSQSDDTRKAIEHLVRSVRHEDVIHRVIERGYAMERWLDLPVYSTGKIQRLRVEEVLAETNSAFQKILIARIPCLGRCLLLNGIMQCAETDHHLYDDAMLAPLRKRDRSLLILGGGDGFVARRALEKFPHLRVTLVEIDPAIVALTREHFGQTIFDDPRVELLMADGVAWLKQLRDPSFDGIVLDLTDHPVGGEGRSGEFRKFYRKLLPLCTRVLNPGGWLSVQAGASSVRKPYLQAAPIIESELRRACTTVRQSDRLIPSFGEKNAFLYARNTG